jgi:hypothetical protein
MPFAHSIRAKTIPRKSTIHPMDRMAAQPRPNQPLEEIADRFLPVRMRTFLGIVESSIPRENRFRCTFPVCDDRK